MSNKVQTPTNPVNEAHKVYSQPRTKFPTTYHHLTTELYGLLNPFFAMECVEGDTIPLNSLEDIRTHTLSAPLMSEVHKHKDYYAVPMRAILPNTWPLIYANPTQGDDIPEDANCTFNIRTMVQGLARQFQGVYTDVDAAGIGQNLPLVQLFMKFGLICEMFFSNGSLLAKMGCHLSPLFVYHELDADGNAVFNNPRDFDYWIDNRYVPWLKRVNPTISANGVTYMLQFENQPVQMASVVYCTPAAFLQVMREHMDFTVLSVNNFEDDVPTFTDYFGNPIQYEITAPGTASNGDGTAEPATLNIGRLLAYQIVATHFYTNDKVDSIYSAELYRNMMLSLAGEVYAGTTPGDDLNPTSFPRVLQSFEYNGDLLFYDVFSEKFMMSIVSYGRINDNFYSMSPSSSFHNNINNFYCWLSNIFGYQNSLRYGDYFTGSRPSPLAVGDVDTTVVNNEVNAIDMTRSLLMQRFLNSVNRVGRKFSDYVKMLSGRVPQPSPTDPRFLSHTTKSLGKFEVENTGEDQGNIVTILKDGESRYAFSYECNEPSIVLGISWYEVMRLYSKSIDRQFFHRTRFDMFNKFFQYQGDQAIYRKELNARWLVAPDTNFAYTLRYMEYKQRINVVSGGFVRNLPAYAFVTDNDYTGELLGEDTNISPEYIRSRPSEFDRFYSNLTGASLGSYFHFIVKYVNECPAERPMEYAPSVL